MPYYPEEFPGILLSTGIVAAASSYVRSKYNKFVRGESGQLYTVWKRDSDNKIYLAESTTNGATWNHTEITLISTTNTGAPALAVKSDGTLIVCICSQESGDSTYRPYVMEKPVGGSWQNRVRLSSTISGTASGMAICTDKNDHIHIAMNSYGSDKLYYFTDESGSWSAAEDLGVTNTSNTTVYLSIQADSNDNIFFAYNWSVVGQRHTYVAVRSAGSWGAFLDLSDIVYTAYGYGDEVSAGAHVFSADDDTIYVSFGAGGAIDRAFIVWSNDLFVTTNYCRLPLGYYEIPQTIVTPFGQFIVLVEYSIPLTQVRTYEFVSDDFGSTWTSRLVLPSYKYTDPGTSTRQRSHIGTQRYPAFARLSSAWQGISSFTTSYDDTTETLSYFIRHSFTPDISQFILEVDLVPGGGSSISQFILEVEKETDYSTPSSITQFIIEVEDSGIAASTVDDDFTANATIIGPTTQQDTFSADARIRMIHTQGRVFTADAVLYKAGPPQFTANAKIRKAVPTLTEFYPDFDGPYEVRLLDWNFDLVRVLERFERLDFTRAVNGKHHSGYGQFQFVAAADLINMDEFVLDYVLQVRRMSPTAGPVVVFEGLVRFKNLTIDEESHKRTFTCAGPDLKHFMKRRIIVPSTGEAFSSFTGPFTNTMRLLMGQNASAFTPYPRTMPSIYPQPLDDYGIPLTLHYRHTRLSDELEQLANVEDGADWDLRILAGTVRFEVFYLFKGKDRRREGAQGWPEMVWSVDRGNVLIPSYTEDRIDEVTATYVAGEGIGVDRQIVERLNVADRHADSPWNRIEAFIDASSETSEASLKAQGDAYNVEHGMVRVFTIEATRDQILAYGKKWNLGDICTGEFDLGGQFDMRIVEVREILDPGDNHISIYPTFFVYPRLEDY